jgi:arylsulfatase A-like enzyme
MFSDTPLPRSSAFNEADMRDKPSFTVSDPLSDEAIVALETEYRNRLRSLQALDEMIEQLVVTLEAAGEVDNTYLFFTSDNGYHMGEYRLESGKGQPYEVDIRVPLIIRGPGVMAGATTDALVVNSDLPATIAELAGAETPEFVDGRSLLPLFGDAETTAWRAALAVLVQRVENYPGGFALLRTPRYAYIRYLIEDAHALYDLSADPYQVDNIYASADPALVAELDAQLQAILNCAGATCRAAEDGETPAT